MGELVYRLKYRQERDVAVRILQLLERITGLEKYDAIIPVPSSTVRAFQPVDVIATALGAQRGVRVLIGFLQKGGGGALKSIDEPDKRGGRAGGDIRCVGL